MSAPPCVSFDDLNRAKANFESIYHAPDPRSYFRTLGALDYQIPANASPVFKRLIAYLRGRRNRQRLTCLDLGCSYGINAALLRTDLRLADLVAHYRSDHFAHLDDEARRHYDRNFFATHLVDPSLRMIGLDVSGPAIRYACAVGCLADGYAENLELHEPSPALASALREVDLVITTGAVGYVSDKTFRELARCFGHRRPWIACFVLRMYPFAPIDRALSEFGYKSTVLSGRTFRQRRFRDAHEREEMAALLRKEGLDPAAELADGYYHAEFHLAHPCGEAAPPLNAICPP
ncbi:MAG: hypothetical protein ACE5ED_08025 [Rhodothalassiaceae bacterium]